MGSHKIKTVDMSESIDEAKITKAAKKTSQKVIDTAKEQAKAETKPVAKKVRSKRYVHARSQVDKTKTYSLDQTLELLTKISKKSHPTLTADVNYREENFSTEVAFPHSTGKQLRIAIANEEIIAAVEKGHTDFDVLIATPDLMPKIAQVAKILGPRGLMPNPKNGTVTKNPDKKKQQLEAGKITIKTERKAPIFHIQVGHITQPATELTANIETLIQTLNPGKIRRLTLSTTMSPGVKVDLSSFTTE